MRTAIVYYSEHHGNTKRLLDAIAEQSDITLVEASGCLQMDLSEFDLIGFASGIYYSKFHDTVLQFAEKNLPHKKKVFILYTYGVKRSSYADAIKNIIDLNDGDLLGTYYCPGFDTFGPFKLIGGIAKGRPNSDDVAGAVKFFQEIINK